MPSLTLASKDMLDLQLIQTQPPNNYNNNNDVPSTTTTAAAASTAAAAIFHDPAIVNIMAGKPPPPPLPTPTLQTQVTIPPHQQHQLLHLQQQQNDTTTTPSKKHSRQQQTSSSASSSPSRTPRDQSSKQSKKSSSKKQLQQQRVGGSVTDWAVQDAADYSQEFDFQANLAEFDKQSVFKEIAEEDETPQESLLVNLNRLKRPQNGDAARTNSNSSTITSSIPINTASTNTQTTPSLSSTSNNNSLSSSPTSSSSKKKTHRGTYFHTYRPLSQPKLGIREMVLDSETGDGGDDSLTIDDSDDSSSSDDDGDSSCDVVGTTLRQSNSTQPPPARNSISGGTVAVAASAVNSGKRASKTILIPPPIPPIKTVKRAYIKTVDGVPVPCLSSAELDAMDSLCASNAGPNPDQQLESGARSAAMLVMQALGGSRRLRPSGGSAGPNHNAPPFVVVLAGECRAGGYAIATARMLANHECNVVVCWTGGGGGGGGGDAGVVAEHGGGSINGAMQDGSPRAEDIKSIEGQNILPQLDVLPSSGARLVDAASELPNALSQPVDLIIDGLLGGRKSIHSITSEGGRKYKIVEAIRWSASSMAPKLSLEAASGLKGLDGNSSQLHVSPKWTLAFGLPLHILHTMGREYVGELFIADIGFPKMLMPKVEIAGRETHNLILASHTGGGVGSGTDHEVVAVKGKLRFTPFFGDKFVIGMVWSSPNDAVVSSGAEK